LKFRLTTNRLPNQPVNLGRIGNLRPRSQRQRLNRWLHRMILKPKLRLPRTSRRMITGTHWRGGIGRSVNPAGTQNQLRSQSLRVDAVAVRVDLPTGKQPQRAGRKIALDGKSLFVKPKSSRPARMLLHRRNDPLVRNGSSGPSPLRHPRPTRFWTKADLPTICSSVWSPRGEPRSRFR